MKRNLKLFIYILICLFCISNVEGQQIIKGSLVTVKSPNKNVILQFYQKLAVGNLKEMCYTVNYMGKPVILPSVLDIELDNHLSEEAMGLKVEDSEKWCGTLTIKNITTFSKDTSWSPVCGEQHIIRDHYNQATIELVKADDPIYQMNVEIRVYDEGVGIRYFFPENPKGTYYHITGENTTFTMPENTKAWVAYWAQGPYEKMPLNDWAQESERPLTLELPNGAYACLTEAGMVDYARTKFKLSTNSANTIETSMYTPADMISPFSTPWRVIMVAKKAGDIIQNDDIILNLNKPNKISDASWIKPGKMIRVMSQTTQDAEANIDFAFKHHLQYILFDWKWYGPAFDFSSDATKVDLTDLDLPEVIKYGNKKGIGVWLYVNMQAMYLQSDSLFSIYRKWGVKGVKIGFVQVGSYRWTTWIENIIKKAAENHIMLDIHDDWRPTGEQRTWPNLMTAEGIRGNEEMPDATHNTVLPFTRFIAGPADYTICYFNKRIKTTHAHQLALAVIYYSPLTTLYWYDKPEYEHNEPELEFWDKMPTTWDDTKIIQGVPGQFITTARRRGKDWFVGSITNDNARNVDVPLNFLESGKSYIADIYSDDPEINTATHVKMESQRVSAKTIIHMRLLASGGQAIYLRQTN